MKFLVNQWRNCMDFASWLKRYWMATLLAILAYGIAQHWLYINWTNSLPYRLVWVEYGAQPALGDLMVYHFVGSPFRHEDLSGLRFFKRVAGVAGGRIEVSDRTVTVNGRMVGFAKLRTRTGEKLDTIAPGIIPAGHYFAQSDSLDSFDSRYAQSGLVKESQVIGVAHVVF